jgi:hypothetical protein
MEQLILIQSELKCPKGNYNAFGKFKYRSVEQILESVKPILLKYKCHIIIKDDLIELGAMHVMKATVILSNGKDSIEVTGLAGIDYNMKGMSVPQMYGTASSYARKYALGGLFLIDDNQDADELKPEKEHVKELDVKEIKTKIKECKSIKELTTLFNSNKAIGLNLDLMADFSYQKEIIQSQM